jgi:hypothetical protein
MGKESKVLVEKAVKQGWRLEETSKGFAFFPPDPKLAPVYFHGTESDHRAWKNTRAEMKRRGFVD